MDKSSIVTSRHSFLVIRRRLQKNYLAIKKKKETYKVIVSFMYSPVHIISGSIVLFPALRDVEEN